MPRRRHVGPTLLLIWVVCVLQVRAEAGATPKVRIVYQNPARGEAAEIYRDVRERRVLEGLRNLISDLRLSQTLTLRMAECGGEPNAWYAPRDRTVTVCYDYIRDLRERAPSTVTADGVTRQAVIFGGLAQVFLHEVGHALFDLLDIPVLGREEDAADQFAALVVLRLPPAEARRVIDGGAHLFRSFAALETVEEAVLADSHGLFAQRLYNLLCLAYGSDRRAFAYLVDRASLPSERAVECAAEYAQAADTMDRVLHRHLRGKRLGRGQIRRAFRWIF
ncbi:DUF4344 domain-containing metallopeptidase [Methylobacterium dankookense]|uniref:Uncharacterized protein n=1 Tax=Methylobacterium dankookense TaxID=560405 RepID=A0A564G5D4_9HYPH|nr:DUF4344 domain-containing metallopeptidase [Methylobacterium dankookense]GJD59799.1 hypothetical protein IFDJLNFL_5730 [Methylobacterium dankookense]VUF15158.1 hypothetical protein MTDSW087_04893 [Methylobacterium dankookense]